MVCRVSGAEIFSREKVPAHLSDKKTCCRQERSQTEAVECQVSSSVVGQVAKEELQDEQLEMLQALGPMPKSIWGRIPLFAGADAQHGKHVIQQMVNHFRSKDMPENQWDQWVSMQYQVFGKHCWLQRGRKFVTQCSSGSAAT